MSWSWGAAALRLAYGFALLICLRLAALLLFSDDIFPDFMNCQTVESHNGSNIPSSGL